MASLTQAGITFGDGTSQSTAASSAFPAGTLMLFQQTAAPTGWTKQTTHDNKALRVVSGTAGSGGTTAFTSVFANQTPTISVSIGATTLSIAQIPSHAHNYVSHTGGTGWNADYQVVDQGYNRSVPANVATSNTGGGGSHTHSGSGSSSAITLNVQYVDLIIASKD